VVRLRQHRRAGGQVQGPEPAHHARGGAGYQFFDTEDRSLALEGGLTYVNEDYEEEEDDSFAAGRWAVRYTEMLFGGATQFFHDHEGIVSVEDPDDMIFRAQTGLRFPLVKNLSGTLQYNVDWQNTPPRASTAPTRPMS